MNTILDAIMASVAITTSAFVGFGMGCMLLLAYHAIVGVVNPPMGKPYTGFDLDEMGELALMLARWWVVLFIITLAVLLVGKIFP